MRNAKGLAPSGTMGDDRRVHLDCGAIVDEVDLEGLGLLTARYHRDGDSWTATFTLTADPHDDLAICHKLVAPTLADARRAVPLAAAFLAGDPLEGPASRSEP